MARSMQRAALAAILLIIASVLGTALAEADATGRFQAAVEHQNRVLTQPRGDRRSLLARKKATDWNNDVLAARLLGKKKKKGLSLGKVSKAIKNAGDDLGDLAKSASKQLNKVFKGKWLPRDKDLWDKIEGGGEDAWKGLLQGTNSIDDYMNNHFVDDLEWIGRQIAAGYDVFCGIDVAVVAVIYACSVALNAALCAATSGCGPWCGPDKKLIHKINEMVGISIVYNLIKCGAYHALKEIDGLCKGRAMGLADQLALGWLGDPFTPTCTTAISCSCGDCWWECSYEVHAVCQGSTWKNGIKDIANALAKL